MQPNSKGSAMLKKLPIWRISSLVINPPEELSQLIAAMLNSNYHQVPAQSQYSTVSLYPLHIDQYYQILTAKPVKSNSLSMGSSNTRRNNRKDSEGESSSMYSSTVSQPKRFNQKRNGEDYCAEDSGTQDIEDSFTIVHDVATGKSVVVELTILAWIEHHGEYVIVWTNECQRCQVKRINKQSVWNFIASKQKSVVYAQSKRNQLSPLNKRYSCINMHHKAMYLVANQPIFHWELTSPVWVYSLEDCTWKQDVNYKRNARRNTKANCTGRLKQERKLPAEWMVMVGQVIVYVGSNYIRAMKVDEPNKVEILKLIDEQNLLINPEQDTFVSCTMSTPSAHRLLLTKPISSDREPILFCLSVSSSAFNQAMTPQSKSYHNYSMEETKTNHHSTHNDSGWTKSMKIQGTELYLHVWRYDIGIFLHQSGSTGRLSDQTRSRNLSEIIKQIEYMQITESISLAQHSNHSASISIFSRKSEDNKKLSSSTRTHTLNLYSHHQRSQAESNLSCIEISHYAIPLSQLEIIGIDRTSKTLIDYFQRKEYCDLLFLAEKREIVCNRELFQFYSSKFKKLYSSSQNQNKSEPTQSQIMVKLDHTKFATIYFLVQHMYEGFSSPIKGLEEDLLIDLMVLAQKFQIGDLQHLCEQEIQFNCGNFSKLYDYFRNSETVQFRQNLLKFFIIHAQQLIKLMPIGKVEELIRLVYCPECSHTNLIHIKGQLENTYTIKDTETGQNREVNKMINYSNIIKNGNVSIKICAKCFKLMGFGHDSHRKNKSTVRGSSVSARSKKKDNNSN